MTNQQTQVLQRNFSIYPSDLDALNEVAARFNGSGRRNLSAALRFIISEWQKQQEESHDASGPGECATIAV